MLISTTVFINERHTLVERVNPSHHHNVKHDQWLSNYFVVGGMGGGCGGFLICTI